MATEVRRAVVYATPDGRVDTENAATYLGIAAGTLQNLRAAGLGPTYVTICRRVTYRIADLDAFVAAQPIKPATALGRERARIGTASPAQDNESTGS